jgi:hypothetical protein
MSRAWLVGVLDRALPEMIGADRDRLADEILDALPIDLIGVTIQEAALQQLCRHCMVAEDAEHAAKDVAGNAALAVVGVLGDADVDEAEEAGSAP